MMINDNCTIIPAIDLLEGKVVRFMGGMLDRPIFYPKDPLSYGKKFLKMGLKRVQLIDTSASKSGRLCQFNLIDTLRQIGLHVQYGGGIRSLEDAKACLQAGADRLIIGTAALTQPGFALQLLESLGSEAIVLALDVQKGDFAIRGWTETIKRAPIPAGIQHVLLTDIARDGMLQGVDASLYASFAREYPKVNVIAAGGVSSPQDIQLLVLQNIQEIVVGRAFYE